MTSDADSISFLPYDLPDAELARGERGSGCMLFVPPQTMVVIGKGSDPALELRVETISEDSIPVLRRGTGGCAVILSPEMAVVSFALAHQRQRNSSEYFKSCNAVVIRALTQLGVSDLEHVGTSDIARHGRKIAGTAIYRNRDLVFYHAVINLRASTEAMERYLAPPPRMPNYRNGRTHSEFVTSLAAEGFTIDVDFLRARIETEFETIRQEFGLG